MKHLTRALIIASLVTLAACGGGGAPGATSSTGTPSSTQPIGQAGAARLLTQATFGPTYDEIGRVAGTTYDKWFEDQAVIPPSLLLPSVKAGQPDWRPTWWRNAVLAPDQLRQRMAFALSEIFVVHAIPDGPTGPADRSAAYYDILVNDSLGNFRKLLEDVTLSPEMGLFLNMLKNDKPNPQTDVHADENYAREVMQLFSVGLVQLNPDGTTKRDINGAALPTYTQADVAGLARVFTGFAGRPTQHVGEQAWLYDQDYTDPMVGYENHHDVDAKNILGGTAVPAGGTTTTDLKIALDAIFNHANVGPFISKQLIQRLVTSNPSPAYVQRVSTIFNDNGKGVRGDLLAVAKAILTDQEATTSGGSTYGKLREPILRITHLWRAFNATDSHGNISQNEIINDGQNLFSQSPLGAPSVFNFFVPDYVRAGPLADAGLVAPEFQVTNETTTIRTANQFERQAYQFVDSTGAQYFSPDGYSENLNEFSVLLHTNSWEQLADDPTALVDRLSLVLMQGQMPTAMRTSLISYVNGIPAGQPGYRGYRVIETASLILNSPQYSVQR
jgi:uncharacterized protein (DUF1800 family)